MIRREALPELLAPAGSPAALYAAVEAGADAVYLGIADSCFHARAGAKNFTREELSAAIPYAHAHGVRVYVAMNTLQYDREMAAFLAEVAALRDAGADALIVADIGCMRQIAERFPDVELHASTQAFAHNLATADALADLGCARVVLARETSLVDIRRITAAARAEIEVFLHGALCVSHSGQCLFSSLVGGRSGNRGECAQPCRLPYNGGYPLSLKDLCLAAHIPALIESGVASLKIEGRMKSADYVYGVTRIYRRLLDERRAATQAELEELHRIFSRDGFTDGYFTGQIGRGMGGVRRESDKANSRATAPRDFSPVRVAIEGGALLRRDEAARLTLSVCPRDGQGGRYAARAVSVTGTVPEEAKSAAVTKEALSERLRKLGDSFFGLAEDRLTVTVEEGLFLPVGGINALRRAATEALTEACRPPLRREGEREAACGAVRAAPGASRLAEEALPATVKTAVFYRPEVYTALKPNFFDICFLPLAAVARGEAAATGVLLPAVVMEAEWEEVSRLAAEAVRRGARYALVSSLGAVRLARSVGLLPFGDFRMNITNKETAKALSDGGLCGAVLSPELSTAAARDIGGSYIVYGRVPLMVTERCFVKETLGCDACGRARLTDRMGVSFPVFREPKHRALVFNSLPTYLGDQPRARADLARLGAHFIFSDETEREAREVIAAYSAAAPLTRRVRRAVSPKKK